MESIMTRKRKKGKLVTLGISLIVMFFTAIMWGQIKESKSELKELKRQEEKLQTEMEVVHKEAEELEERRVYVQTKKYVEEIAKQIGFVYPDEIIYKPQN